MSSWVNINGIVRVSPLGRTLAEERYILETVLDHLPVVTGSERDMSVQIVPADRYFRSSSRTNEFGEPCNNLSDTMYNRGDPSGDGYFLVLDGALRDREFSQSYRELMRWLCRLAKRVIVDKVLVEVECRGRTEIITDKNEAFFQMFEPGGFCSEKGEVAWCEYLMWTESETGKPIVLEYKYNKKSADSELAKQILTRKKVLHE